MLIVIVDLVPHSKVVFLRENAHILKLLRRRSCFGSETTFSPMTFNHCQKSLEHQLNNAFYMTIVSFRSNLSASDPLSP